MSEKPRLRYEKPVSIDLGRVAPILGDTCSIGNGAADCPAGMNNAMVAICQPYGASADNDCRNGSGAGTFCWLAGAGAAVFCLRGDGHGGTKTYGVGDATPPSYGGGLDSLGGIEPPSSLGSEPGSDGISGPGAF